MINGWLVAGLVVIAAVAGWLAWRYGGLRLRLAEYVRALLRMSSPTLPVAGSELADLSHAVQSIVSDFNREQAGLRAERDRLAAILDQMADGVLIADAGGTVQFANPAARRLFASPEPVGRTVTEVVRHHQLVEAWLRSRQTGELQSESVEIPARREFLQLLAMPDRESSGSLLFVQDLTRVRRLETIRRDFISNISHELRTPLASLKSLTETLEGGALADPEAGPWFLGRMSAEVDALTQMAQELLDLSRIESGQVQLELAPLEPKALLQSVQDRMQMQAERAALELRVECPDGLPRVHADRARLEQVLVNLVHNAVKFTRPGGHITLAAEADGGAVRFSVADTGVGIPAEHLGRVFERFYRVDRARSGGGTGLGLSISRHIVEAHGGRIWVESTEGRGSTFCFTLPVAH